GVARDRDRIAEAVVRRAIGGGELLLLGPDARAPYEHVGRARGVSFVVVGVCTDDRGVARERDRSAEAVARRAVGGDELLLLGPDASAPHEHVGRARGAPVVVIAPRRDDRGVARERDRLAEAVARRAVGGGELLLLGPD